jgi:hypothetical protein
MKRRVLVISSCAPPLPGRPVTGGGLRTAQLAAAVKEAGHVVVLMIERAALGDAEGLPEDLLSNAFEVETLADAVAARRPDVVVLEQWALAAHLGDVSVAVVLDLHGSLLLENVYRRGGLDLTLDAGTKIECLRRADLVLVPAAAQINHFSAWMTVAGFDPRRLPLAVMPLALPESPPPARRGKKPALKLIYGGARWPWIDSLEALRVAADVVSSGSSLDVHTYAPPRHGMAFDDAMGTWAAVDEALAGREGIRLHSGTDHASWRAALSRATVALDLWEPNPERTLAATTRTIEFLWAGLPVITVEGAAWAEELVASGAGWTIPAGPTPGDALRSLLQDLRDDPPRIAAASRAATSLVRGRHSPASAASALIRFVEEPSRPPRAPASLVASMVAVREAHLDAALESLRTAHGDEHERIVGEHRAEVAQLRAAHRGDVEAQVREARAETGRLTAAHDEQIRRMSQERREEVDRLTASRAVELAERDERHRVEIGAVVADWQERQERTEAKRRKDRDRALEKGARLEVELRAEQARRQVMTEEVERLRAGPAMLIARRLKRVLLNSPSAGRLPGRLGPGARLARLFAEHSVDRDA